MSRPPPIRFQDGAAYERGMGGWSRLAGEIFLDWLAPAPGQRWIDVGCGSGAFTELIVRSCDPASVRALDPSQGQIDFARKRPVTQAVEWSVGDAHRLPYPDASADAATLALVIFFLDDPAAGLAELRRVLRPGGLAAAYAWDLPAHSFPLEPILAELRALGTTPATPPSAAIAAEANLHAAWQAAGFTDIRQRSITVTRRFPDFEEFWQASLGTGTLQAAIDQIDPAERGPFEDRVRATLPPASDGSVSYSATANAIVGTTPRFGD